MALPNMQDSQAIRTIGKYKILGTLGRGAMGVVYRAQDPEIGRVVAIKVLRKLSVAAGMTPEMAHERFKIEARAAGNLRHPHIITVFDVNIEDESPYIVMDFIDGQGLDAIISKYGKLDPQQILYYLSQVAGGLDYAHVRGIVHRDIKPSNILVDKTDTVFILDFGVASAGDSSLNTEPVMGTPSYMSPEQILHRDLDRRSDLFSLAVVAFECFTGTKPFPGDTFSVVVNNILNGRQLSLSDLAPELPLSLEAEFERAFSKEPAKRFGSAEEMISAFAVLLGMKIPSSPGRATSNSGGSSSRKRRTSDWKNVENRKSGSENIRPEQSATQRDRRDTPAEFSPWRPEHRTVRADAFKMTTAPEHVSRPGAMYSDSEESFRGELDESDSKYRLLTVLFGIMCIVLSGVLAFLLFGSSPSSEEIADSSVDQSPPVEEIDPLSHPIKNEHKSLNLPVVPAGKAVTSLSDREILAVLSDESGSEARLIETLQEGRRRALPELMEVGGGLLQRDSYVVRIEALKMFGELADPRAVPVVVIALDDHDPLVRRWSAKALAKIGDRKSVGYLQARLTREDMEDVKNDIKKSIEKITGIPYAP